MIKAIIFDMDGLMLDTERMGQRAWQQAGAEKGYDFPLDIYRHAIGRTAADTERVFKQAFGPDFPFNELYARKQQFLHEMLEAEPIPTKSGLFVLLDAIEEGNMLKAVATSTARPLATKKLTKTGLLPRFAPNIVCGNEIANGKPAPDIFLAAAALLDVAPADCLVLEDSEAGIRAARAAGMQAIMIPDMKQPSPEVTELAHAVLPSLADVHTRLFS